MKKIIFTLFVLCAFAYANAQDVVLTSKNGTPILPQKGDWAIGVSAAPFLDYFGDFLSDHGNTAPTFNFFNNDNVIIGKYFLTNTTALRGSLRIGLTSTTTDGYVQEEGASSVFDQVKDKESTGATNITLGLGLEKRRGKGRLQGYYGAEAMIGVDGTRNKYTYGNAVTSFSTVPDYTYNFGSNIISNDEAESRVTELKSGTTFMIGVRAFIGAEYFILPKISIGGEFGWGISVNTSGDGTQSVEYWNGTSDVSGSLKVGNTGSVGADTDNLDGNIFVMFHF